MTISCTRKIEFDAAHRIMLHESNCKMLHGHRYCVEATFSSDHLDKLGRVIDFGVIRDVLGKWINDNWDHNTILNSKDKVLGKQIAKVTGQKIYYIDANPTAEEMANYLMKEICPKLFKKHNIFCVKIKISETPNCYAEVF